VATSSFATAPGEYGCTVVEGSSDVEVDGHALGELLHRWHLAKVRILQANDPGVRWRLGACTRAAQAHAHARYEPKLKVALDFRERDVFLLAESAGEGRVFFVIERLGVHPQIDVLLAGSTN
jgi:hypothetical protein